ncbi:MAG: sugar kinase, partial [Desulfovibrio sp.]|nr:sugar kinase [Desulfovibrio sp.]
MAWLICGSVPDEAFSLCEDAWAFEDGGIVSLGTGASECSPASLPVRRGTPALIAACACTLEALGDEPPRALLCGDAGRGSGSRALYRRLEAKLPERHDLAGITFHYLFPDIDGHGRVLAGIEAMPHRPLLVADAGFMYAAKMSGFASVYDLFTPDLGELAFLADEQAPHPFYTRGFLLSGQQSPQELLARACQGGGASRWLLVKGAEDLVCQGDAVLAAVSEPQVPALEAVGGTGDIVTG